MKKIKEKKKKLSKREEIDKGISALILGIKIFEGIRWLIESLL